MGKKFSDKVKQFPLERQARIREKADRIRADIETVYHVRLNVFAFETLEEADKYRDALVDAFCKMPESKDVASACTITDEHGNMVGYGMGII